MNILDQKSFRELVSMREMLFGKEGQMYAYIEQIATNPEANFKKQFFPLHFSG